VRKINLLDDAKQKEQIKHLLVKDLKKSDEKLGDLILNNNRKIVSWMDIHKVNHPLFKLHREILMRRGRADVLNSGSMLTQLAFFSEDKENEITELLSEHNFYSFLEDIKKGIGVIYILGSIGSGKTALSFLLAEYVHKNSSRVVYAYNFPVPKMLPEWIYNVSDISALPPGCLLLFDDSGLSEEVSSKSHSSKKNKDWANLLKVIRHKRIKLIMTIQNTAFITPDDFRAGEVTLILKYYDMLARMFERDEFKDFIVEIMESFEKRRREILGSYSTEQILNKIPQKQLGYIFSQDFPGEFFINGLPTFWTQELSEAFSNWIPK